MPERRWAMVAAADITVNGKRIKKGAAFNVNDPVREKLLRRKLAIDKKDAKRGGGN